ncbi:hypothetical protein ACJIZ3_008902 [Penstemon smallii]|uniref:Kinesin motor domain-containing protein n=1 Tax=Penstemon smallii TaxID=265156 RepID=A0ABD3TC51_9LAMI
MPVALVKRIDHFFPLSGKSIDASLKREIIVDGLREEIVTSAEQVLELMACGESLGETNMNVYSSKSHTIFRMEGTHINKILRTLGTVINKLSEGIKSHRKHVPYRESKLTRILQPAIDGNANTAIICNITLAQKHVDETKSSLQFASRALRIKNYPRVNEAKRRNIWCSRNLAREKLKERTIWDIQIDYLARKLIEVDFVVDEKCSDCGAHNNTAISHPDKNSSLRESDDILLIKQLHTDELHASHSELSTLKEEVSILQTSMEESKFHGQKLKTSLKTLLEEKELLMEHKKVKVIVFEMEATISSLEDQLTTKNEGKHEAIFRAEILATNLHALCDELNTSHSELTRFVNNLFKYTLAISSLEEFKFHGQKLGTSLKTLSEEKEELLMEEHKKVKVVVFEMEATITSLEDQLAMKNEENHEAISRAEILDSDLQTLCEELHASHLELSTLEDEVSILKLETSLKTLSEGKEELLMLKVLAFEMEATIASLEDQVAMKNEEKHEAISRAEILDSDLQTYINSQEWVLKKPQLQAPQLPWLLLKIKEDQHTKARKWTHLMKPHYSTKRSILLEMSHCL